MPEFQRFDDYSDDNTDMWGALGAIPGVNVVSGALASGEAHDKQQAINRKRGKNAYNIELPELQMFDQVNAEYAGDVNPEMYGTPEEAQYALAQDSAEGRAAQLAALQQMAELTDQSAGSTSALGRQQAEMDARQLAQSREGAIRQDAMRRGQVGGAADMIARQQAAQAAANQNLSGGLQSAQQAALMQLAGTQAGAGMAGQLRGQDQALAFKNQDAINQFNMFNTGARNAANQANVGMRNQAAFSNNQNMQNFLNNRTNLGMNKIAGNNSAKQSGFGNQMSKYNAMDEVLAAQAGETQQSQKDAREAGKEGWSNLKDLAKMAGGGM